MHYYLEVLKKYAVFKGQASPKEFWMFVLFNLIFGFVLVIIEVEVLSGEGVLSQIYSLAMLIPYIAVSVRRLHDTNRSGWLLLISLIPFVVLLCFSL